MEKELKRPNFFIVGAPKCGTTAMYEYLRQHPEIFMPEKIKEPSFFCKDFESSTYIRNLNEYLSLFSGATTERMIGEASAIYLYSKYAAKGIKEFCPSAKIIIMLRNPLDMMYSFHSQCLFDGNENIKDFEVALEAEEDRKKGFRIPISSYPKELLFYRELARFSSHVKRYLNVFGRDNVYIIIFDDFIQDTARIFRETLKFLNVKEDFFPEFKVVNPNKRRRSKLLHNFLLTPPLFAQRLVRILMPLRIRQIINEKLYLWNIIWEHRKPMSPELRHRLQQEFKLEIEKLSELIGRDLTFWTVK